MGLVWMLDSVKVWNWYSRESVQRAIVEVARGREVASIYKEGNFGKRPNVLNHPGDILQAVAEGSVSFHGSVEHWSNPMKLDVGMAKPDQDALRTGWDIFIDPDVPDMEIGKIVVKHVIEALRDHGVYNYSLKFSGGKGFHIGIPFSSMPESINMQPTSSMYPEMLQKINEFIKWYTREQMRESMLRIGQPNVISQRINKPVSEITKDGVLDPFKVVSMDVFSSRHLFRLPYSLHEKTGLVSLPIRYERLENFDKEVAQSEKVKVDEKFLQPKNSNRDASGLVVESLDWAAKHMAEVKQPVFQEKRTAAQQKMKYIPEDLFPPCIRHMLGNGLADGKKRGLFILINFLRNMGWTPEQVEKRIDEWNAKNIPPLRTNYLRGQLRWHFRTEKPLLPPNCENENYYKALGVFGMCENMHRVGVRNPVSYPFRMLSAMSKNKRKAKTVRRDKRDKSAGIQ